MKRLIFSGVLLAWAACTTSQPETPADVGRPNVLFVFYDQYRPDIIGAYGGGQNITTPNLDRLAREGMLFTNALSTTPVCTPYRGMLMTGRYRRANEPFFIMVAPHPPHPPWDRLPDGYLEQVPETLAWDDNVPAPMQTGQNLAEARAYYAMSKNADDNMGRILDYLDTSGLAEDTIVVFTSDHGEMLGSHGRRNKMVPYDEAVQVPMLVRWPGHVTPASRTDTLQTPLDHMPTLIRMAGLETPQGLDGIDLSPELLDGETMERDAVLMSNYTAHWDYFTTASQPGASWPEWRGVKTKQYTYARWITGETELYDDLADPEQLQDLSGDPDHAGVVDELEATLQSLLAEAHDAFLPGNAYVEWIDRERNIIETGAGPVGQ